MAADRPVVTLGVFDGLHRGHQAIIDVLTRLAQERGAPSLALTFTVHPRTVLGRSAPPLIASLEKRLELFRQAGLDAVWLLDPNREFFRLSAHAFAQSFFRERLRVGGVVLGDGARFGRARGGSVEELKTWGAAWEIPIVSTPAFCLEGVRVSSTAVRLAVQAGDLARASRFLGRAVAVTGTVVHGQGLARAYGFPTLNLDPHHELRPPPGVYRTRTRTRGELHASLTNVGRPPTDAEIASGLGDLMIETHLLDYDADLYGEVAEILFLEKIREVERFASPTELIRQVGLDLAEARRRFAAETQTPSEEGKAEK